jgi:carbon storage regulator CsrA
MLVLSRRTDETVIFPTINASIKVVAAKAGLVRLGIEAPEDVPVFRAEVLARAGNPEAVARQQESLAGKLPRELRQALNNHLSASTVELAVLRRQLEMGLTQNMAATLDKIDQELGKLQQWVEQAAARISEPSAPARCRALVVEDDRNECELLAAFLRLSGMHVETAGDGADALDYLRERGRPDVVFLDMLLPRCGGPSTVRAIRGNPAYAGLKIFGVTGANHETFGLSEGPDGIDRWFRKPLNPEVLVREAFRYLGRTT